MIRILSAEFWSVRKKQESACNDRRHWFFTRPSSECAIADRTISFGAGLRKQKTRHRTRANRCCMDKLQHPTTHADPLTWAAYL